MKNYDILVANIAYILKYPKKFKKLLFGFAELQTTFATYLNFTILYASCYD